MHCQARCEQSLLQTKLSLLTPGLSMLGMVQISVRVCQLWCQASLCQTDMIQIILFFFKYGGAQFEYNFQSAAFIHAWFCGCFCHPHWWHLIIIPPTPPSIPHKLMTMDWHIFWAYLNPPYTPGNQISSRLASMADANGLLLLPPRWNRGSQWWCRW